MCVRGAYMGSPEPKEGDIKYVGQLEGVKVFAWFLRG